MNRLTSTIFGGFIGSLIALEMHSYLWWVGMLVGSLTGYLSYEFALVKRAFRDVCHSIIAWHPDWEGWRNKCRHGLGCLGLSQTFIVVIVAYAKTLEPEIGAEHGTTWLIFGVVMSFFLLLPLMLTIPARTAEGDLTEVALRYRDTNPVTVFLWHIPRGAFWVVAQIPAVIGMVLHLSVSIIAETFRAIHSEERTTVAVYAATGTAIGYFSGSALIGSLSGGIIGECANRIVKKYAPLNDVTP